MKRSRKLLSLVLSVCMLLTLSVGAFASVEPSTEPEEEDLLGDLSAEDFMDLLAVLSSAFGTTTTKSVDDMTASDYEYLTNYSNRKTPGKIFVEYDETGAADIELNETVEGEGFTAVYAHGEDADVTVSGKLTITDDSDGQNASDFSGQGSATVAYDNANLTLKDLEYYSEGFERGVTVVSQNSTVTIEDSDITVMGADALNDAWEGYHSSADQNYMISPPWPLGLYGGGRILNMIGTTPKLIIKDSVLTGGKTWGLLSTDSGSNMTIVVVDSDLNALPEIAGGSDSGWRIFGYDEGEYGSAYGSYYIGNPTQYYYGAQFNGVTYAAIITGAEKGVYASSNGTLALEDASGEPLGTVEGEGRPTVINGVFGFMQHNSISDGIYVLDGTIVNSADAIVIQKAANGNYVFDNAHLNSEKGVLFQMMDNDDDSRIGGNPMDVSTGFSETYSDSKINSHGVGFPGINYDVDTKSGGNTVTVSYTNGSYNGDIFNGTGYYGQSGDNLVITIGEGAVVNGDIALTSTIKGLKYSDEALEGIEYYGDDIKYNLLSADGSVNAGNDGTAEYIQITDYTINEYFLQGHVENLPYFNGVSTISVIVEDGGVWNVAGNSLITSLEIKEGGVVNGNLTENADGSLSLSGASALETGVYGGTITAVGGGVNVGGGVDASGELNVGAAAAAIADEASPASGEASGLSAAEMAAVLIANSLSVEPSGEPSAESSGEPSDEGDSVTVVIGGQSLTLKVYEIDGEKYIKLSDLNAAIGSGSGEPAEGDWGEYQEYLIEAAGGNAPDLDEFKAQVYSFSSWDELPLDQSPWDQLFSTLGISTFEQFMAGQRNSSQVEGAMG